jgi:hypothetical protein
MSLNAAALKLMAEKGLSIADVIEIAEAMEVRRDSTAAERQQRHREKIKAERDNVTRDVTRDAEAPSPNEYISNPLPVPQSPKGDSPKKKTRIRSDDFEVPSFVPAEPWAAFAAMRRAKKKPIDSYMAARHFGKLRQIADAGWNLADVIDKATNGFWDGFWMPDGKDPNIRRANDTGARQPFDKAAYDARLAKIDRQESTGPPRPIGDLVGKLARGVGNG